MLMLKICAFLGVLFLLLTALYVFNEHCKFKFKHTWLASTILAGRRQLSWPVKRSVVNPSFPSFSA